MMDIHLSILGHLTFSCYQLLKVTQATSPPPQPTSLNILAQYQATRQAVRHWQEGNSLSETLNIFPRPNAIICFPYIVPFPYQWPNCLHLKPTSEIIEGIIFFIFDIIFMLIFWRWLAADTATGFAKVYGYPFTK